MLQTFDCDLCGTKSHIPLPQYPAAAVCTNCGFLYVRERRSSEEIARAWDEVWEGGYSSEWPAVKARLYYVAEYLDQLIGLAGKAVLDIGAGEGTFLDFVVQNGGNGFGVEPDPKNCHLLAGKNHPYFNGPVEQYSTKARFDVVTILWTLENTGDCMAVLRKAREVLRPDGHICVATGSRILVPFKKPLSSYFSDNPPDLHCFRWSASSLQFALLGTELSPVTLNDYVQNDWLVAVAGNHKGGGGRSDAPAEVLSFFERWEREFP